MSWVDTWQFGVGAFAAVLLLVFTAAHFGRARAEENERQFMSRCVADGYSSFECKRAYSGYELPCKRAR